jgi:hypothetical protein
MKYFHRTHVPPDAVIARATAFFGARMSPTEEAPRRRRFTGAVGQVAISAQPEGGHFTLVIAETNQAAESEADRLAKRFLAVVHTIEDPTYVVRGAY